MRGEVKENKRRKMHKRQPKKCFIDHRFNRLLQISTDFLTAKASAFAKATADRLRHEEKSDRITGLTESTEFLAGLVFSANSALKASF